MRFFARFDRRLQGWGVPPPYIIYSPFTILCSLFTQAPFQEKPPARVFPLFLRLRGEKFTLSCAFWDAFGVFRRLRTATKGAAFGIRKPFEKA